MGLVSKILQLTSLSVEAQQWLEAHLEELSFKKNDVILQEGKVCNYLYFIKSGIIGGHYFSGENEVCNWIAAEGDLATSYYSFISRTPSYEIIECFESCTLQAISESNIQKMYALFPESERAGRLILEEYYSRLEERLIGIQFKSAKERYEALLEKRPEIVLRAPLGRVASYLGIKQETLSRIRASK
ncbi:MAG TPA: Crp/Fnr family transcriptional regulator [Bacteroidia bacterium]